MHLVFRRRCCAIHYRREGGSVEEVVTYTCVLASESDNSIAYVIRVIFLSVDLRPGTTFTLATKAVARFFFLSLTEKSREMMTSNDCSASKPTTCWWSDQ